MANDIGKALEDISRATGAVAHFYKTLKLGDSGSSATLNVRGNEPSFQAIIDEVQSVRGGVQTDSSAAQNSQSQPQQEESKSEDQVFQTLTGLLKKEDMMKFMMGKLDELAHIPPLVHDTLKNIRDQRCQGSNQ